MKAPVAAATLALALVHATGCGSSLSRAREARARDPSGQTAEVHYRKALTRPSQAEAARRELAGLYVERATEAAHRLAFTQAERELEQALAVDPRDAGALEAMARLRLQQRQPREAHAWAERATAAGCSGCTRLRVAARVQEAEAASRASDWRGAEAAYAEAFEALPSAPVALGLARARYALRRLGGAVSALRHARDLLGPEDVPGRGHFVEIRRAIVLLALHQGEVATADAILDLTPQGLALEAQIDTILEATAAMEVVGAPALGARRLERVVLAAEAGQIRLEPALEARVRQQLARLHGASARVHAHAGRLDDAEAAFERAQGLEPENAVWGLERAVLEVSQGDLERARELLAAVPTTAEGRAVVEAIVLAYEAMAYVQMGELAAARATRDAARHRAAELPEVHVATAMLLAASPVDELPRAAFRELQRSRTVPYPSGEVVRAGEALAELDVAQRLLDAGGPAPYRAVDVGDRAAELQQRLRSYYPFLVAYRPESAAVLHVHHRGAGELRFEIRPVTARSRVQTAILAPGQEARFEVRAPAVVRITAGTRTEVFLAEPHTMLSIPW